MTYAGDVSPTDAFAILAENPDAVLVDVRTRAELAYVGYPDLSSLGKRLVAVEWQQFPTGVQNESFLADLADQGVTGDGPVLFICRSGARSRFAAVAATANGFSEAYNVADGFEGHIDQSGHRGASSGWKASDLPWRQT
jgi:rhodanese-related sulfurtransferase